MREKYDGFNNNIDREVIKQLTNQNGDCFQGEVNIFKGNQILQQTTYCAQLPY